MQPYLYPYAGYFRLLAAADVFVLFDDVQFPRRGRVHRCAMPDGRWLTLPMSRSPRETRICDLPFATAAQATFAKRLGRFQIPASAQTPIADAVCRHLHGPLDDLTGYLERGLHIVAAALGIQPHFLRSSELGLDATLRGQDRVLAIVKALGATRYLNAPGGRHLYQAAAFRAHGIELRFLTPYDGAFVHLIPALLTPDALPLLRADLNATTQLHP